jgi:hypothetical protein
VAAWRGSGQTAAEYSKQHGLTLSALQRWSHRLRREASERPPSAAVRLARVERGVGLVRAVGPGDGARRRGRDQRARVRVERGADGRPSRWCSPLWRGRSSVIPHGVEVFVALDLIDLRWGFHRLAGVVTERLGRQARSGALFVFFGKRRDAIKVLFFDGTGICLFCLAA